MNEQATRGGSLASVRSGYVIDLKTGRLAPKPVIAQHGACSVGSTSSPYEGLLEVKVDADSPDEEQVPEGNKASIEPGAKVEPLKLTELEKYGMFGRPGSKASLFTRFSRK
jgi:hypothetical protein